MKRLFSILFIFVLAMSFILLTAAVSAQDYPEDAEATFGVESIADRVYINANVLTVDKMRDFTRASAFAVKDGWFCYVGDEAGVQSHIGPGTLVFDLEGKTVIPGLHDSHVHIRYGSRILYPQTPDIRVEIGEWASVERMQEVIKRCLATGEGIRIGEDGQPWLVLSGWMSDVWDPPEFRKELIDAVAPDIPVYISRYTHGSGANSKALELAGITKDTPDPSGGHIKKDANGEVTGEFVEAAPPQLTALIPRANPYTRYETSRNDVEGTEYVFHSGLTTIHGASRTSLEEVERRLALYESGIMRIRINEMVHYDTAMALGKPLNYDNRYFVQSAKVGVDGALGSRGALLLEEYSDYPGYTGERRLDGIVDSDTLTPESHVSILTEIATNLIGIGFNVRTHCIGDGANRVALDAFEASLKATGADPKDVRFAIEHSQILAPEDIPRFAELGIIASMQPLHATEDMHFAESRLGPERIKGGYIWSDLIDLGVVVATGTDYSVSPYNPFYTLHAAVTRQDRENNPPGGWYPEQAMTIEEALYGATMAGAYTMKAEDILGSIETGKLADFVVIPVDLMTLPPEDLWKIEPDMTVIGGEVVYTKPVQAQ
jgi:predicted amidohydrolase YtcJ